MYLPPQFAGSRAQARKLMQAHPFASLISVDDAGLPFVTHLPLVLEPVGLDASLLADSSNSEAAPPWVLLGHVAKPIAHAALPPDSCLL